MSDWNCITRSKSAFGEGEFHNTRSLPDETEYRILGRVNYVSRAEATIRIDFEKDWRSSRVFFTGGAGEVKAFVDPGGAEWEVRINSIDYDDDNSIFSTVNYSICYKEPVIDPCAGVVCNETECVGDDLYGQTCVNGACVRGTVIEIDSEECITMIECNNPRADINQDGVVDNDDQIILGAAYGSRAGDANWNPDADINQDGVVDSTDLGILGANFGCTFKHDPCAGVVCNETECVGDDLYGQTCVNGACIRGPVIETDSEECMSTIIEDESKTPWAALGVGIIGLYYLLTRM